MRRLENYIKKYGPEFGPVLYHALQSQAAHAGVSARLRRKIDVLTGKAPAPAPTSRRRHGVDAPQADDAHALPLFPEVRQPCPQPDHLDGLPTPPADEPDCSDIDAQAIADGALLALGA